MKDKIIKSFEEYLKNSSLWKFYKSLKMIFDINKIKLLRASSYIPLPEFLKNKKAILNPMNDDQKYLLWCVGINEFLKINTNLRNSGRIKRILKNKVESFNIKGMKFPCGFSDIDKFGINLFDYDEEESNKHKIFPLRVSKLDLGQINTHANTHVNLLLISNENGDKHYCLQISSNEKSFGILWKNGLS